MYRFESTVQNQIDPLGLFAIAIPWVISGLEYVVSAVAGLMIGAAIVESAKDNSKEKEKSKVGNFNKPKCPDDVYKKLIDKAEETKRRGANLGSCKEGMSNFDLQVRIDASIEEAKARKIRESTCWEGGDDGHKEQINNIHKRIDKCRNYIRINNRRGLL